MTERFHTPPTYNTIADDAPLVFLAGPIQGSPDWQTPTAQDVLQASRHAHVASPRRVSIDDHFDYDEQVKWEKNHLRRSLRCGVIMFWFAARDLTLEYEEGRSYAQTSRIEIGRTFGWYDSVPFPLTIGFEESYTSQGGGSERYIRHAATELGLTIHTSLDDLLEETLSHIKR